MNELALLCNLEIHNIPPVPEYIAEVSKSASEFVGNLDATFISLGFISLAFLLIFIFLAIFKNNAKATELIEKLKGKLMWSSVLRAILQGYFIQTIN